MPAPSPSPAMLKAAAAVAAATGCTVELPVRGGGVVRVLPPEAVDRPAPQPAKMARKWGESG